MGILICSKCYRGERGLCTHKSQSHEMKRASCVRTSISLALWILGICKECLKEGTSTLVCQFIFDVLSRTQPVDKVEGNND